MAENSVGVSGWGGEWVGEWVGGGRGRDGWAGAGCVAFCCMNGRGGEGSG